MVRIELRAVKEGTELTLIDTLEERGKAARDGAGWHVCLDGLAGHLGETSEGREGTGAWSAVRAHYVECFGPEAVRSGHLRGSSNTRAAPGSVAP